MRRLSSSHRLPTILLAVLILLLALTPSVIYAFSNGQKASKVIGQPSFTTSAIATTQNGLFDPQGVVFDSHGNLWVGDINNRVLEFPANLSTSTKVSCTPSHIPLGSATTCTVTVTDTGGGTSVTPTGMVTFTSSSPGTFSSMSCTLSGSDSSASCTVMFTHSAAGTVTITGKYAGDSHRFAASYSNWKGSSCGH